MQPLRTSVMITLFLDADKHYMRRDWDPFVYGILNISPPLSRLGVLLNMYAENVAIGYTVDCNTSPLIKVPITLTLNR